MTELERIAGCAREQSDVILNAKILPGKYLVNFQPAPTLSRHDACCMGMGDNKHFPMGTEPLRLGFTGVAKAARENTGKDTLGVATLQAIDQVYTALAQLHEKAGLSPDQPRNFIEALQVFYTAWRFRSTHGTASIGRLDQYLYPFYQMDHPDHDLALGALTECWEYLNEIASGDTLITMLLGGTDEKGQDVTNELSLLMLEASLQVRKSEPHISVRFHPGSPKEFIEKSLALMALGHGQATIYYDDNIIPELKKAGIPGELACNYVNNGCTEIMIDQRGLIEFENLDAVKILELALFRGQSPTLPGEPVGRYWTVNEPAQHWSTVCKMGYDSGDPLSAQTYEELEDIVYRQFDYQLHQRISFLWERVQHQRKYGTTNPLLNGSFEHTLKNGGDVVRGDLGYDCLMLFSGSLPTVADGLSALKDVVYDQKLYTLEEVLAALKDNFQGHESLQARLLASPKFGNDHDMPDLIAARLQDHFCQQVKAFGDSVNTLFWPSLIGYKFVQEALITGATPDGRKWKDPICEHYSATPGKALLGPTALLCSVAKAPLKKAFGVAPVHISLSRQLVDVAKGEKGLLSSIADTAGKMGLNMLNVAIYDTAQMRAAQKNPDRYADLIVRVWGYSARFIDLSPEMQEHVINRVAGGGQ